MILNILIMAWIALNVVVLLDIVVCNIQKNAYIKKPIKGPTRQWIDNRPKPVWFLFDGLLNAAPLVYLFLILPYLAMLGCLMLLSYFFKSVTAFFGFVLEWVKG